MQTPASITTNASIVMLALFLFIIFIFSCTNYLSFIISFFPSSLFSHLFSFPRQCLGNPKGGKRQRPWKRLDISNKNFNNKEDIFKLIKRLSTDNDLYKDNKFNDNKFSNDFKYLANGVFQAEGHIGGYYTGIKSLNFRPIVFIGITANVESLKFLVLLNSQFNLKMSYNVEKLPSGLYFVKLYSRDWNFIINNFIPYFNKVYGDKYKGLKRLEKLYISLLEYRKMLELNNLVKINILIERIIFFGYNLIDNKVEGNSKRKNLMYTLLSKYKKKSNQIIENYLHFLDLVREIEEEEDNKELVNNYFLLGLILGDGHLYVKIRKSQGLPWFIPLIRVGQKIVENNFVFLNKIKYSLSNNNIKSNLSKIGHLYVLKIESIDNVDNFSKWLPDNINLWFWKKEEYLILKKALLLMKIKAKYWQKGKEILLNHLYKLCKYEKPIEYWQSYINNYYLSNRLPLISKTEGLGNLNKRELYYISLWRDKAWSVKLPIKIKPKVKFFFFKTYNSEEEALLEAKKYRNDKLDLWLKENKLI